VAITFLDEFFVGALAVGYLVDASGGTIEVQVVGRATDGRRVELPRSLRQNLIADALPARRLELAVVAPDPADATRFGGEYSLMGMTASVNALSCVRAERQAEARRIQEREEELQRRQEAEAARRRQEAERARVVAEQSRVRRERQAEEAAKRRAAEAERVSRAADIAERARSAPRFLMGGTLGVSFGLDNRQLNGPGFERTVTAQFGLFTGFSWRRVRVAVHPIDLLMMQGVGNEYDWGHRFGADLRFVIARNPGRNRWVIGAGALHHSRVPETDWKPFGLLSFGGSDYLISGFDLRFYGSAFEVSFVLGGAVSGS
jgi:hypothetical protein